MTSIHHATKKGKVYQNPVPTSMMQKGAFFDTLWQYMTSKAERVPKNKPGPFHTDVSVYKTPPASGLRITWMGHSSLLIEIDGKRILTDPVWNRASFVSFAGPERFFAAPLALQNMPPLDAIIISHDHYDHFDEKTIKILAQTNTPFYCSVGVGPYLQKWGVAKQLITEMDWSDSAMIGDDCKLTATPARHFSGRGIVNRSTTLWSSFVIKGNKHNIFFGADSGWFPGFKDIGDAFGPFDLTMLEIGAYNKNWADIHMGPVNATEAHLALRGKVMMPIHWGTFNLALHPWREPVELLQEAALQKNITLLLPEPGMPTEVPATGYNSKWWEKY